MCTTSIPDLLSAKGLTIKGKFYILKKKMLTLIAPAKNAPENVCLSHLLHIFANIID